jgi:hypothetical protein
MNESSLNGHSNRFRAVGYVELGEDVLEIALGGVLGDVHDVGDLLVGQAFGEFVEDFDFARGEGFEFLALGEAIGDFGGDPFFAGGDGAEGRDELFAGGVFQDVALGAGVEGLVDVFIAVEGGEHDDAGGAVGEADFLRGLHAAFEGHAGIEQDEVGLVLAIHAHGLGAVGGLGDDFHVWLVVDDGGDAHADDVVVVGNEDTDFGMGFQDEWVGGSSCAARTPPPSAAQGRRNPSCVWGLSTRQGARCAGRQSRSATLSTRKSFWVRALKLFFIWLNCGWAMALRHRRCVVHCASHFAPAWEFPRGWWCR